MKRKWNSSYCSVAENFFSRFPSALRISTFALLLLTGCSGFYTSHPVADRDTSDIDPRLDGLWKSVYEYSDPFSWAVQFSGEDHVTGKLSLFRHYSKKSKVTPTNVFSVRCIRKTNKGVCSAKLDGTPVPLLKEDMRGWLSFDFNDTCSPGPEVRYAVARYEIQENGNIAVYADSNLKVLEKRVEEKDFASNKDKAFVVIEPAPGLTELLENAEELFKPGATMILAKLVEETTEEVVARLVGQLNKGPSKYRYDAAWQLGQLGKQAADAAPALTKVIWDALASEQAVDFAVVRAAVQALGRIGVASPDTLAALEALRVLNRSELETAIGETIQILKQKRENPPMSD